MLLINPSNICLCRKLSDDNIKKTIYDFNSQRNIEATMLYRQLVPHILSKYVLPHQEKEFPVPNYLVAIIDFCVNHNGNIYNVTGDDYTF